MEDQPIAPVSGRREENRRYYLDHKEDINRRTAENMRNYRKQNPEKYNKRNREIIQCPCGAHVMHYCMSQHKKSAIHKAATQ
jgi:hypothetical protein